jgi:protein involved in polysaccharide export with SLBB domain
MVLMRVSRLLALSMLVGLMAGCTGQELYPVETAPPADPLADPALAARFEPWSDTVPTYRIGEGDKLRISFLRTPEMDQDTLVRPDGIVTLRSAGEVEVAGLKPLDAAAVVAEKAKRRLRDPEVSIEVLNPVSSRVFIGGEVKTPGVYQITGPMDPIAALQLAGGAAETGRINQVILIRRGPDDRPMLRLVDVRSLIEGRPVADPRIVQGDIIYVPRTRVAEVGLWVDQYITKIVPFQRSFSYSISSGSGTTQLPSTSQ